MQRESHCICTKKDGENLTQILLMTYKNLPCALAVGISPYNVGYRGSTASLYLRWYLKKSRKPSTHSSYRKEFPTTRSLLEEFQRGVEKVVFLSRNKYSAAYYV